MACSFSCRNLSNTMRAINDGAKSTLAQQKQNQNFGNLDAHLSEQ